MNPNHPPHLLDDDPTERVRTRLQRGLGDDEGVLPAPRGPRAAVQRAAARRRRRRTAVASVAAIGLVAFVGTTLTRDGDDRAGVSAAAQGAAIDATLELDWTATDDGLSYATDVSAGDGGTYALSTAPDTRYDDFPEGAPRALYQLAEDGSWTPITIDDDDPAVARVSQRGGALYAMSTAATTSGAVPQGSVSTDGGQTWSSVPLEPAEAPSDAVSWQVWYGLDLASTAERTMALVTAQFRLPYEELFPELDGEADHLAVELRDAGVALVQYPRAAAGEDPEARAVGRDGSPGTAADQEPDVVRTVTWAELGVSGPTDLAPQHWAYLADGEAWTPTPTPVELASPEGGSIELEATTDEFVVVASEFPEGREVVTSAQRSSDGEQWTPVALPDHGQLLALDDALVALAERPGQVEIEVSRDAGLTWSTLDLRGLDPRLAELSSEAFVFGDAGPLGLALLAADPEAQPLLLFSADLERWTVSELSELTPDRSYVSQVVVGADHITVLGHTAEGDPGSPERTLTLTGTPRRG